MSDPTASVSGGGRRILLVEDTMLVAEAMADALRLRGFHVVGPAPRLAKAMTYARQEQLDAALLDVNLAGEQSFPVVSLLTLREIPFAFLTGYGDNVIPAEFQHAPCLRKPTHTRDLLQFLDEQLNRNR